VLLGFVCPPCCGVCLDGQTHPLALLWCPPNPWPVSAQFVENQHPASVLQVGVRGRGCSSRGSGREGCTALIRHQRSCMGFIYPMNTVALFIASTLIENQRCSAGRGAPRWRWWSCRAPSRSCWELGRGWRAREPPEKGCCRLSLGVTQGPRPSSEQGKPWALSWDCAALVLAPGPRAAGGFEAEVRGALDSWQDRDIIRRCHRLSSNRRLSPVLWQRTVVRPARDTPGRHLACRVLPAGEVSGGCELLPTPPSPALQWGAARPVELHPCV